MKRASLIVLLLAAVALTGCTTVDSFSVPNFGSRGVKAVAIVHVVGDVGGEAAKNQIADFFAMEFMRKGFRVVERYQAVAVLKEQAGKLPAASYDEQAVFVGRLLGVNAVVVVNIPKFDQSMNLTAKLLDVKDGSALWIASGSAETGEVAYTILGATAGAIGGAMIGGGPSEHLLGGIAGAAVGGVAGNALAPQRADKLKTLVRKMCAELPHG